MWIVVVVMIAVVMIAVVIARIHHVAHRRLVTAAEAFAIVGAHAALDARMAELIAILDVRLAMVVEIFASAFNAIMETLPLNIAELLRRRVPPTLSISWGRWALLG